MPTRRELMAGAGAAAALVKAWPAAAQAFDAAALPNPSAMGAEVALVNRRMGPTRLTASPEHQRFVAYLRDELTRALAPAGGAVFEDRFENYPRWSAGRCGLRVAGQALPVASYFPYCTGGFTGKRGPLEPASGLTAPGTGGGYARAGEGAARIIAPRQAASGELAALGTFTKAGSIDWAAARGKVALVAVSVEAAGAGVPTSAYRQLGMYDHGRPSGEPYRRDPNPTNTILNPPDISNAAKAGVEGVVLIWEGVSDGNAEGQYNPFPVPFGSYPPSSQAGSDPAATAGGVPTLWVTPSTGAALRARLGQRAELTLEASIDQADTATVWGWLPGESDGEILICNTHSDGPNIVEENGGLAVLQVARYFARLPRAQRPKSMVFMASTGHFGHRFLGSGRDWIAQHPQIMARAVGCMTLEHFGCREWEDARRGERLVYAPTGRPELAQIYLTDPKWQTVAAGPPDPALARIATAAVESSGDRAALLSGGVFFGEGGGFHTAGVPTIGYIPVPQYLCAMAPDGEISKFDPALFHEQTALAVRCFLAMQQPGFGRGRA